MFDFLIGFIEKMLTWIIDLIFSVVKFPDAPPGLVSTVNQMFDIGYLLVCGQISILQNFNTLTI